MSTPEVPRVEEDAVQLEGTIDSVGDFVLTSSRTGAQIMGTLSAQELSLSLQTGVRYRRVQMHRGTAADYEAASEEEASK